MQSAIQPQSQITVCIASIASVIADNLAESSKRQYGHTYTAWCEFAATNGIAPLDLTYDHVSRFIHGADVSKSTRQNRLSHIRKLVKLLAIQDPRFEVHSAMIHSALQVKRQSADKARKGNSSRALTRTELAQVLDVWAGDDSDKGIRNHALIRLLVYAGLRRSEVTALMWEDIDLEGGTIQVRHGKGDKSRVVAIADATQATIRSLKALQNAQGGDYHFVFPRLTRGRNPRFGDDKTCDSQTVLVAVRETAKRAGIGHISPHDLRRTHITTALDCGATLADMQAQAGHARAETTLRYAKATDAKARRNRIAF